MQLFRGWNEWGWWPTLLRVLVRAQCIERNSLSRRKLSELGKLSRDRSLDREKCESVSDRIPFSSKSHCNQTHLKSLIDCPVYLHSKLWTIKSGRTTKYLFASHLLSNWRKYWVWNIFHRLYANAQSNFSLSILISHLFHSHFFLAGALASYSPYASLFLSNLLEHSPDLT